MQFRETSPSGILSSELASGLRVFTTAPGTTSILGGELLSGLRVFTTAPGTTSILRGELPSGLQVFTTVPGTTQTEKTQPIFLISSVSIIVHFAETEKEG